MNQKRTNYYPKSDVLEMLRRSDDPTAVAVREAALAVSDMLIDTDCSCREPLERFVALFGLELTDF
ncbi:MAG: hypothetical protein MJZ81_09250 [Bacteroidales bacterium]|nr:hypothetical protein [Bacteroidales bacterium]